MRNPTLSDVALAAGVSYATADRVINERGNVSEKSARKVHGAMRDLAYVRNVAAANLSRGRTYRLAFLLPKGSNAFFARVRSRLDNLSSHLQADQINVSIIEIDAFEITALQRSLQSVADAGFDGIAVVGLQSPEVVEPLKKIQSRGTAVIGLISDLPTELREAYIGIDNVAAGRTSARLLGMAHAGKKGCVQTMAGSLKARDHKDRLKGFRDVIQEDYPNVTLLEPVMTRDRPDTVKSVVENALSAMPGVTAVYNVGAGNIGLVNALSQNMRKKKLFCIVHELVLHTHQAVLNKHIDIVIDQRPDEEIDRALTTLKALIDGRSVPPMQDLVPTIYVRDNLPSTLSLETTT